MDSRETHLQKLVHGQTFAAFGHADHDAIGPQLADDAGQIRDRAQDLSAGEFGVRVEVVDVAQHGESRFRVGGNVSGDLLHDGGSA